jgi:hypothetical protein
VRLSKQDRLDWICAAFANTIRTSSEKSGDGPWREVTRSTYFDSLHSYFVDAYIEATGARFQPKVLGAHLCDQLIRDMKELHDQGVLTRHRSGVEGMGRGWPKWVWAYRVADGRIEECRRRAEWFKARHPDVNNWVRLA